MKKLIMFSIATLTSSLFTLKAQGTWSPRAPLPDSARGYGIGFSIGNYGYMGLGTHNPHVNYPCLKDFWQFDPSVNSWARMADFPGKARICPITFVIGNYAYIVTGQENDSLRPRYTAECWQYNATTNSWTQKANFPGTIRAYGVGFSIGSKGYIGLGSQYYVQYLKDFWQYDTATDSWAQLSNFGGTARIAASGFAVNGKGYVCFGDDSITGTKNDMWEYDPATKVWTQKTNNPGPPQCAASGFVLNNTIYVGAGTDNTNGKCYNQFWQYNTLTDTWANEAYLPGIGITTCSSFAIIDTGYLGLGVDSVLASVNNVYKFYIDSTTTGIETLFNSNEIVVYPNPFNFTCLVSLPKEVYGYTPEFSILDIAGRKVGIIIKPSNSSIYLINRNGLKTGIYILSIKYNNQVYYRKLVITD